MQAASKARASAAQQGGIGAPDGPRQRGGVGDPGEVREEETGGPGADAAEGENGGEKEDPEEDDTHEGAGTGVPLEEEPAPEGVDGELEAVEREGPADGATVAAATLPGAPGGDGHEGVEDAPDGAEQPRGRGPGGTDERGVEGAGFDGGAAPDRGGEGGEGEGDEEGEDLAGGAHEGNVCPEAGGVGDIPEKRRDITKIKKRPILKHLKHRDAGAKTVSNKIRTESQMQLYNIFELKCGNQ